MQIKALISSYVNLFKTNEKDAKRIINLYLKKIRNKYPDIQIDSLQEEEDELIFVLENKIKVKFSPPDNVLTSIFPIGYSAIKHDYTFQLCAHLGRNAHLLTDDIIKSLKKLGKMSLNKKVFKNTSSLLDLRTRIAKDLLIPEAERTIISTYATEILPLVMRIKNIHDNGIVPGSNVMLKGDKKNSRSVYKIQLNYYLRLKGIGYSVDPQKVTVVQ